MLEHPSFSTLHLGATKEILSLRQECIPVGCVPPSMHCAGGVSALGVGVSAQGVLPLVLGGYLFSRGVHASMQWGRPPPPMWTDRYLWKQNLRKLRLRAVKIIVFMCLCVCLSPCVSVHPEFRKRLESLTYFADLLTGYGIIFKIKMGGRGFFKIFGEHESFCGVTDTHSDFFSDR